MTMQEKVIKNLGMFREHVRSSATHGTAFIVSRSSTTEEAN